MIVSFSTIVGIIAGAGVIFWSIAQKTDDYGTFWNLESLILVLGATVFTSFLGFRGRYIIRALFAIPYMFVGQKVGPKTLVKDVEKVVDWSKRIQKDGKKASETIIEEEKDPFLKYAWGLYATGYSASEIREFGETSIEEDYFRHLSEVQILSSMSAGSPAFGMVGTLIGLILMLQDMEDPSTMGPGLSVALATTLYGVLMARFIFQPTSSKHRQRLGIKRFQQYLMLEGIVLIADRRSPFYIADKLNSFLDIKRQYNLQSEG